MSRDKKLLTNIPGLYQSNYFDIALFNFVQGILQIRPTFRITAAVDLFIDTYKIDYTDFPTEHGQQVYYRMLDKYRKSFKFFTDDNV